MCSNKGKLKCLYQVWSEKYRSYKLFFIINYYNVCVEMLRYFIRAVCKDPHRKEDYILSRLALIKRAYISLWRGSIFFEITLNFLKLFTLAFPHFFSLFLYLIISVFLFLSRSLFLYFSIFLSLSLALSNCLFISLFLILFLSGSSSFFG